MDLVLNNLQSLICYKNQNKQTEQSSKCRLCGDKSETIIIINECSKLAQKECKSRNDWVGKGIHLEWYKKFKFDHKTNGVYTIQNLLWRNRRRKFTRIFRYKQITRPRDS